MCKRAVQGRLTVLSRSRVVKVLTWMTAHRRRRATLAILHAQRIALAAKVYARAMQAMRSRWHQHAAVLVAPQFRPPDWLVPIIDPSKSVLEQPHADEGEPSQESQTTNDAYGYCPVFGV